MADVNISKSESIRKDDTIIHEQTNPSFHDTPEDAKNYKSLQNKTTMKKSMFMLKPSLLTQKAEQIRTDKAAVSASSNAPSNKFLVLGDNPKDLSHVQTSDQQADKKEVSESSGFVFGENIFSRVVKHDSSKPNEEESAKEFKDLVCNNNEEDSKQNSDNDALRKSANELSQKQIITQQYEEAEIITGEEEETNVLKTLCKLFLFNSEKNEWVEKGFCNVHLNDMTDEKSSKIKSRLVVRSKGGLKVLVNTLIWSDMGLARASIKAVRITAQSEEGIKSYLLTMQNATDADMIYFALLNRKTRLAKETSTISAGRNVDRKREILDSDDSEDGPIDVKKRVIETKDNGDKTQDDS